MRRGERETLDGFLDWYRAVAARKVEGLTPEDAKRVMTPTGLSALGVLKHLGWVERAGFAAYLPVKTSKPSTGMVTTRLSSPSAATTPSSL